MDPETLLQALLTIHEQAEDPGHARAAAKLLLGQALGGSAPGGEEEPGGPEGSAEEEPEGLPPSPGSHGAFHGCTFHGPVTVHQAPGAFGAGDGGPDDRKKPDAPPSGRKPAPAGQGKLEPFAEGDFEAKVRKALAGFSEEELDGIRVFAHPGARKVYIDLMDWGDPGVSERVGKALAKLVGGEGNVSWGNEQSPPGDGWTEFAEGWDESKHPRADDGEWSKGGGGDAHAHEHVAAHLADWKAGVHPVKLAQAAGMTQKKVKESLAALEAAGRARQVGGGLYAPASAPPQASPPAGGAGLRGVKDVAKAFLAHRHAGEGGVDVADLAASAGLTAAEAVAAVRHLQKQGALTPSRYEGRGGLSPAQLAVKEAQAGHPDPVGLVSATDSEALRRLAGGAAKFGEWDESKHPRGQPGNAGEFGHGGGAGKKPAATRAGARPDMVSVPAAPPRTAARPRADLTAIPTEVPVLPTGPERTEVVPLPKPAASPGATGADDVSDPDHPRHPERPGNLSPGRRPDSAPTSDTHRALESAATVGTKSLDDGMNASRLLTLEGGGRGVYKPAAGEHPGLRRGVRAGTYYRREVAASAAADLLGLSDLVPATVFRDEGGAPGSAQDYIDGTVPAVAVYRRSTMYGSPEDLARAAVFDYLTANTDRHGSNWMVRESDDKLVLIDHGLCFPTAYDERDFHNVMLVAEAVKRDLPMPDLSAWEGRWPAVEESLRAAGLENAAVALAKDRWDTLTSGAAKKVADLPRLNNPSQSLRDARGTP